MSNVYPIQPGQINLSHLPPAPDGLNYFARTIQVKRPEDGNRVEQTYNTTGCFRPDAPDQTISNLAWTGVLVADFDLADFFAVTFLSDEKGEAAVTKIKRALPHLKSGEAEKVLLYMTAAKSPEKLEKVRAAHLAKVKETIAGATDVQPTYLVDSGWGYHAYWWIADVPTDAIPVIREENRKLVESMSVVCGYGLADIGVHDSGTRILRPLGTTNDKDIRGARDVKVVEQDDGSRWVLGESLKPYTLPPPTTDTSISRTASTTRRTATGTTLTLLTETPLELPPSVEAVLVRSKKAKELYEGKGKAAVGPDGKARDISGSGYDFSLAQLLKKEGVSPEDIAKAVYVRNGGRKDLRHANRVAGAVAAPKIQTEEGALELRRHPKTGQVVACLANVVTILEGDDAWKDKVVYDEMADRLYVGGQQWSDDLISATRLRVGNLYGYEPSVDLMDEAAQHVGRLHKVNPLTDYLSGLVWDGVPRVERFLLDHVGAADTPMHRAYGRCFLVSAVARAFEPGCQVRLVLTLIGPGNWGKSKLFRLLASDDYFLDSTIDIDHKDGSSILRGRWIVEFGEMHGLRKSTKEAAKAYLSRQVDTFRPAYGHCEVDVKRRCVFGATSNDDFPLVDETGDSRFMVVKVVGDKLDEDKLVAVRDQLWAEAVHLYKNKVQWHLTPEEATSQREAEGDFRVSNSTTVACLEWSVQRQFPFTLSECITTALDVKVQDVRRYEREVANALRREGFEQEKNPSRSVDGTRSRRWKHPRMTGVGSHAPIELDLD